MTLEEFLKAREAGDEGIENLLEGMTAFQARLAQRMTEAMSALEVRGGILVASEANMANLATIMGGLEQGFSDPKWEAAVREYLDTFNTLGANVAAYSGGAMDAALLAAMRKQYKTVAAEYLLNASSFGRTLAMPIAQEVGTYIATGARYGDLLGTVTNLITGGEAADGAILGQASTVVNDLVTVYERSAMDVAAQAMGSEFYYYQGRPIKTTRPFCRVRSNKYFHRGEIESWGNEEWSGQIPGTNAQTIFTLLGGYNCRHMLIPVTRDQVPPGDLQRMEANGYI